MRFLLAPCALSLILAVAAHAADAAPGSAPPNFDRAEQLVRDLDRELDSLKAASVRLRAELAPSASASLVAPVPAFTREDSAIWREVRAEKRRRLKLAEAFQYRRASVGYVFNSNLVFGMNAALWEGDWGARVDGRFARAPYRRAWGANLSLLYALHEFYLSGDDMFTRLYLFGGGGYYWERLNISSGSWYDTPDRAVRAQFGAGTEMGLSEMRGTRFTPELGFQGSRFYSRYNDSPDYTGGRPRSDYSLYPYYALHVSFYFL
jgi:hypothetical protein